MRTFVPSKIAVPLHLAFIVAYLAFVRIAPGEVMAYLPLVWLAAGLVVVSLLFPAARRGEDVEGARERSFLAFRRDYATLFGICALGFTLIQTLNGPRVLQLDMKTLEWEFSAARIRDFPSCFDQILSLDGVFGVLLVMIPMVVIRKSLGRNGRKLLLHSLSAIAAALSLYGLVRYALSPATEVPTGFATFLDPVSAGLFFVMTFSVTCGLLTTELGQKHPSRRMSRFLFACALLTFFGAVFSLSALALVLVVAFLLFHLVYGYLYLRKRALAERKMRFFAIAIVLLAVVAFLHFIAYPENRVHGRIAKVLRGPWVTEPQKIESATLRTIAWRTFADNPFAGVGTWGYSHPASFSRYVKTQEEWTALSNEEKGHYLCGNDALQCLAEYGTLGCLFLVIPFAVLLVGIIKRIVAAAGKYHRVAVEVVDGEEDFFDRYSPLTFSFFLATVVPGVVSFRFSIFHTPLVLVSWTIFLTCFYCFLPKPLPRDKSFVQRLRPSFRLPFPARHSRHQMVSGEE